MYAVTTGLDTESGLTLWSTVRQRNRALSWRLPDGECQYSRGVVPKVFLLSREIDLDYVGSRQPEHRPGHARQLVSVSEPRHLIMNIHRQNSLLPMIMICRFTIVLHPKSTVVVQPTSSHIFPSFVYPSFLNLSRTFINAFPARFPPHSLSFPSASSPLNPMPYTSHR